MKEESRHFSAERFKEIFWITIKYLFWVIRHIGKDDRPLPPSFRRRNPIFVLPLQRNGRHPVTIEPGLIVHKYYNTDFFSDLATKMTDFVKFTLVATGGLSLFRPGDTFHAFKTIPYIHQLPKLRNPHNTDLHKKLSVYAGWVVISVIEVSNVRFGAVQ